MSMNLKHHFLIAMPALQDPFFRRSVIYICEHSPEGAMGIIVNKPLETLTVKNFLQKLKIKSISNKAKLRKNNFVDRLEKIVFVGGPLAADRGFILHSAQSSIYASSIYISENTVITTSRDVLETIGTIKQPENLLVALGYCAWKKNQLENEILENIWLTTPATNNLIFETPIANRWYEAAKTIGVNIYTINCNVGHA